ncbi:M56 family metallopeptidase [Lewinella sp. IMCC34191]|uniref:M56 family metallopeptidase n=1 Tax=Lewinella sp. IMCC34191 TaxID=2259172 RepID=UPI000E271038|nr:M56 family metallopeptidase [Lewinella sp. IMCC34191]
MSTDLTRLLLEATLVWSVLLVFYWLALRKNGNWRLHRHLLLSFLAAGACLPLLPKVQTELKVPLEGLTESAVAYVASQFSGPEPATPAAVSWTELLLIVWSAGTLTALALLAYRTCRHFRTGEDTDTKYAGYPVVHSPQIPSPYAAFGRIYLPEGLAPELEYAALLHEAAHLRHGHFAEKLLAQLTVAALWFHPLPWIYARRLSVVHEYEADAEVTEKLPTADYGKLLLRATMQSPFGPGLFTSPLQNRIAMLQSRLPAASLGGKHLTLLALLGMALVLTCSISRVISEGGTSKETVPAMASSDSTWQDQFLAAVYYPEEAFQDAVYDEMARITVDIRILANGKVSRITLNQVDLDQQRPEFPTLTVVGDQAPVKDLLIRVHNAPKHFRRAVEQAIQEVSNFPIAEQDGKPVASELSFDVFFFPQKGA